MKKKLAIIISLIALIAVGILAIQWNQKSTTTIATSLIDGVSVIHLDGGIDRKGFKDFERKLEEAEARGAPLVILLNCPGGELSASMDICRRLKDAKVVTYCLVEEAVATGLWICLSTDDIYFLPDGVAAGVMPAIDTSDPELKKTGGKTHSMLNDFISEIADAKGHNKPLLLAMMDISAVYETKGKVWKQSGEMLTLTAQEAKEIGFSKGTVPSVDALAEMLSSKE